MAGRGRGGGGRGRGRGRGSMSFNVEQFGFSAGEAIPGPVLQPPPLYPPMERRPVPLKSDSEVEYLLALKRDFIEHIKYSPAYVLPADEAKDIERYSDYKNIDAPNRNNPLVYDWKRFPKELRPHAGVKKKKKKIAPTNGKPAKRQKKTEDISVKLDELEKIEKEQGDEQEEKGEDNKEESDKEEEERPEGEGEEEEDQDEEMDDGTDYVNNYFDNGESYLDEEDDNLDDDGPVY